MISESKVELIHTYIKDLSLENINPIILFENKKSEDNLLIDISSLEVKYRELDKNLYEVFLECKLLISLKDKQKILAIEIMYGGLFKFESKNSDVTKMIYVDCPVIIYPFLRNEIASLLLKSGSNAVFLPYIDFNDQYEQIKKNNS